MSNTEALLAAYDEQVRPAETRNLPLGAHAEQDGPVVRVVGTHHRGFVTGPPDLGVDGVELDRLIERQRDYFAARDESVEWKTRGHDLPAGLPKRLVAAGFVAEPRETVLIGSAAALAAPVTVDGVTVREVVDDEDMRRIAAMSSEVWDTDRGWMAAELIERDRERTVVVVAEVEGRVVSSARLVFEPDTEFAGLWGGATLSAWRGKGIYRALVAYRAQVATARGTRYLQVDATDDSRPILRRLGFTAVTTTTPYVWPS
ncbi:MAG TPA: GNAT family N-acetyltransferase [Pseudonocardiaceae bacterium]|nr:GNAT family N-acetyltransferase [Pseudonocardiaceae bacterium]